MISRHHLLRGIGMPSALAVSLCLYACGSQPSQVYPPPPAPVEDPAAVTWGFEQGGIRYLLEADELVNYAVDRPLAITVRVYQLKDIHAFHQIARSQSGIDALIRGKEFEGLLSSRQFSMQPDTQREILTDRLDDARYLGVVAGYAHGIAERSIAVLPFAVHQEKQGMMRTSFYKAAKTDAVIHLGQESVTISGVERVQ